MNNPSTNDRSVGKKWLSGAAGCLMICGGGWTMGGCGATGQVRPYTSVVRAAEQDVATLSLDAPVWDRATYSPPFGGALAVNGPASSPIADQWVTRAKFAWSDSYLLVRVESVGPPPSSPFEHHDELLHQADVTELFLDVTGERRRIIEVQVSPQNITADYLHIWREPPQYPADRIDTDFYRAHHHADLAWDVQGLRTRSVLEPLDGGRVRWTVLMAVPLAEALAAEGRSPRLQPGQSLYVNLMRYAYGEQDGRRTFRQYNLVPVRFGCPHQSPMAVMPLTTMQ